MKRFTICLMIMCLSLTLFPLFSAAATTVVSDSLTVSKSSEFIEGKSLEVRSNEINSWNRTKLKMADKKSPQQVEIISGRHHRHGGGSVVFITGGSALLLILLLIILL